MGGLRIPEAHTKANVLPGSSLQPLKWHLKVRKSTADFFFLILRKLLLFPTEKKLILKEEVTGVDTTTYGAKFLYTLCHLINIPVR